MAEFDLGNIAGVVRSVGQPLASDGLTVKKDVLWFKIASAENPNIGELQIYNFVDEEWEPVKPRGSQILLGSVINFAIDPPAAPAVGDSYILQAAATGVWAGHDNRIAEWDGTEWVFTTPSKYGYVLLLTEETFYYFNGTYPAGSWNIALGGDNATFDGNRTIKTLPEIGMNPGTTTLKGFLEWAHYRFRPATVSLNALPTLQVGENYAPVIAGAITLNDETTVNARRIVNVTAGTTVNEPIGNTINYTAAQVAIIPGDVVEFRIEADVENNGAPVTKLSAERMVKGVWPMLHGMSAATLGATTLHSNLTKRIAKPDDTAGVVSVLFNGTLQKAYFAYDADLDDLVSIKDPNGFEAINLFTRAEVAVESFGLPNAWIKNMKVYSLPTTTIINGTFKFIF